MVWHHAAGPVRDRAGQVGERRSSGSDYIYTYLRTFYRDTRAPRAGTTWSSRPWACPTRYGNARVARELTTVAMHEVEGKEGEPKTWEKVTTVYDAQGFANVKTEPVANYHGHATFEAKFKAANPAQVATYDNDVADLTAFMAWMSEPVQTFRVQLSASASCCSCCCSSW